ncbi:hypothetical protein STEPF1_03724 [Streptomyces sp. F-1]|nr:hypothetical protein STEPF1_03724 [Streptomyces sp. F-1]
MDTSWWLALAAVVLLALVASLVDGAAGAVGVAGVDGRAGAVGSAAAVGVASVPAAAARSSAFFASSPSRLASAAGSLPSVSDRSSRVTTCLGTEPLRSMALTWASSFAAPGREVWEAPVSARSPVESAETATATGPVTAARTAAPTTVVARRRAGRARMGIPFGRVRGSEATVGSPPAPRNRSLRHLPRPGRPLPRPP